METVNFNLIPVKAGQTLLDIGCGEGRHSTAAQWHFLQSKIIALDINAKDLAIGKKKHRAFFNELDQDDLTLFLHSDSYRLPFADNSIDHIICSEVLEHLPNYDIALNEMHRVLTEHGSLTISVPRYWPEKLCWVFSQKYHEVAGGHIRIFNGKQLTQNICQRGFQYKSKHHAHALHAPYWWLRCLFWRDKETDQVRIVRWYHKFLVWDLIDKPALTKHLEKLLNPIIGKSLVLYFYKLPNNKPTASTCK